MSKAVKSYKGFNKDMTCRGFQYKEGKEYETSKAVVCNEGFHACEHPLDCLAYYPPNTSVYHEVEQTGEFSSNSCSGDSKIASTKIKIGAKLSIAGLVQAAIDFTKSKTVTMHPQLQEITVHPQLQEITVHPQLQDIRVHPQLQDIRVHPQLQEIVVHPQLQDIRVHPQLIILQPLQ